MPTLYYVPIIHSVEDYGSLGSVIKAAFSEKKRMVFDNLQKDILEYWQIVEKRIDEAIPDVRGLVMYQDSLPVGDREKILTLFRHLCKDHPGSPNFRLVKKLINNGAVLTGTEDMNLVMKQWNIYQRAVETPSIVEHREILDEPRVRSDKITKLRDEFIAKRIRDTLPKSGKGILFIGRNHDVIGELEKLPEKFTIVYL
ncbi:MAG: hypothetical protein AAB968_01395 [Patescibacteria group bacterium]